jgi:D-alanyl-D-alanine carboxypeptidase
VPHRKDALLASLLALGIAGLSAQARAEALILVDADSGKVIKAENATYPWYPASVTKLMTLYVTLKAVKEGRIALDTLFTVSSNAVAQQPVKMGFATGTKVTVDNALKMLMVKSANDMAVVLAEGVSGSIEAFADEMNRAAQKLGMTQTSYVNPNGLPADEQITSARDLAILARALIHEFPEHDSYWHIPAIRWGRRVVHNYNPLIDRYPGADGMKTGFICASGYNLVATATRGDKRLIAVVLGAPNGAVRAMKAASLLEYGFNNSGGLSWLLPSLGTVDALAPINAAPPNLRDEMCGGHRKRKGREETIEEEAAGNGGESGSDEAGSPRAFMYSNLKSGDLKPYVLGPLVSTAPPVEVYTGPYRAPGTVVAARPRGKKEALPDKDKGDKPAVAAAKPPTAGKPADGGKPAKPKPVLAAAPKPTEAAKSATSDAAKPAPKQAKPKPVVATASKPGTGEVVYPAADSAAKPVVRRVKPKPTVASAPKPAAGDKPATP